MTGKPTPSHASLGGGRWLKETVLPPGTYEYCLWWTATGSPTAGCGNRAQPVWGRNSLLKVASSLQASHRVDTNH